MPPKQPKPSPLAERAAPPGWAGISSIVPLPDGRVFAASHDGNGAVCLWNADGGLAWITSIPTTQCDFRLDVSPCRVFAYVHETRTAWSLDPATGAILERVDVPQSYGFVCRNVRMSPDGAHVIARVTNESELFSLPGLVHVAKLPAYANAESIAFSADGKLAAVNGHEIHIYDLAGPTCIASFHADSPDHLAFTPSGQLVSADGDSCLRIFDRDGTRRATLDAMPGRQKKKAIRHLAVTDTHVAAVRDDGEIVVFDHATERKRFPRLGPLAIALTDRLWVGSTKLATYAL